MDVNDHSLAGREPDGPVLGVKYGAVVSVDGVLRFEATTRRAQHSRCYDVDAFAVCQLGMDHRVPAWSCTCGFYAMPTLKALGESWGEARLDHWALLTVELFGRVVEHERGWRAARQTVLEAAWEDHCHQCGKTTAAGFGFIRDRPGPLVPLCRECGHKGLMSVGEVAGRLGTDVRLIPSTSWDRGSRRGADRARNHWKKVLLRRVATLAGCGLAVAGVISAASHGSAQAAPGLPQELASLVSSHDPQLTASRVAHQFDSDHRKAVVVADPTAANGRGAMQSDVGAVAVLETPEHGPPACRIVLIHGRTSPDTWRTVDRPATDLSSCADEAVRVGTPVTVPPPTTTPDRPPERSGNG